MALTTIHMIGNRPNAAPSSAASAVCPNGIAYTAAATTMEVARAASAAHWERTLKTPRRRKRTSRGSTAKSEVCASEWFTGSKICLYMVASSALYLTDPLGPSSRAGQARRFIRKSDGLSHAQTNAGDSSSVGNGAQQ